MGIEPPTPQRLARLAQSAVRTIAEQFFLALAQALSPETCQQLDALLTNTPSHLSVSTLKAEAGPRSLDSLFTAVDILRHLQGLRLPWALLAPLSARYLRRVHLRVMAESLTHLRRHPDPRRYALVTLFCYGRLRDLTDRLVELLRQNVHQMSVKAEKRVDHELLADFKRVTGKTRLRFQMAAVSLAHPAEPVPRGHLSRRGSPDLTRSRHGGGGHGPLLARPSPSGHAWLVLPPLSSSGPASPRRLNLSVQQ